jgi:hypothetical protein
MDTRADGCATGMSSSTGFTSNSSTTMVAWSSSSSSGTSIISSNGSNGVSKQPLSRTLLQAPPYNEQRTTANGTNTSNNSGNGVTSRNGNGQESSRRRSAPPISARGSPKGQREYTDFIGHCLLSVPGRRRDLLIVIGCALDTVFSAPARKNDKLPPDPKAITAFHSVSVPTMTIQVSLIHHPSIHHGAPLLWSYNNPTIVI